MLAQREQRAPDPHDGPSLHRGQRRPVDVPAVARPVAVARVGPIPDQGPLGRARLDRFAKLCILQPAARHHRDEATAGAVDVVHVLARTQLAVGDVQEVAPAGHRLERVPGLDVGDRVVRVAVAAAKRHGDVAVGAHGQDEQQLLEVRAVRLRMSVGDGRAGASADLAATGAAVAAAEADRCGVVVELVEAHPEALPNGQHQLGEQRRAVGIEQPVQGAAEPVVAQVFHLLGADAEHAIGKAVHGLVLTVDRLALHDDRSQQHAQRAGMGDGATPIRGHEARQRLM